MKRWRRQKRLPWSARGTGSMICARSSSYMWMCVLGLQVGPVQTTVLQIFYLCTGGDRTAVGARAGLLF